jgi:uncharacterized membrane protein
VTTFQWLLMFHIAAAFCFVGGSVAAGILDGLAHRAQKPSEVAALMRLIRLTLPVIFLGVFGTLVFGIWLWHYMHLPLGSWWIWISLVLWVAANAFGGIGGRRQEQVRELAVRLAGEGDQPSAELSAALRDPIARAMNIGAGLATLGILILMIWKPGA